MTVNIEGSASSIPESLDSLKTTPLVMHRITFTVHSLEIWYAIMHEARTLYSKNWKCQSRVRKKFGKWSNLAPIDVWFEVPDKAFGTWVAVKHAVKVKLPSGK